MRDKENRVGILFAGQGSQHSGMGRQLAEQDEEAMNLWRKAEKISGLNLRGIYWEGSEEEMADTRAQQPALTVVNLNIWRSAKFEPLCAAGHSLGEFSAVAAAGVLGIDKILEIVSLRGKLMAEAHDGAMAAIIKLTVSEIETMVEEQAASGNGIIVCANFNTPTQTVISGSPTAVERVIEEARGKRGRAVRLPVSGAFHSPLMEEANREFVSILDKADWRDPRFPIYSNVTGSACTSGVKLMENLEKQMVSPVLWIDVIRNMHDSGVNKFVEIAPKAVLGKMASQILGNNCQVELA